jgi:hypothetical protein
LQTFLLWLLTQILPICVLYIFISNEPSSDLLTPNPTYCDDPDLLFPAHVFTIKQETILHANRSRSKPGLLWPRHPHHQHQRQSGR